ncbi:hypothetical protein Bca4012_061815 [Brassica carinata]
MQDLDFTNGQRRSWKPKHVDKVRNQRQHLIWLAYASGDLVSAARVLGKLDLKFLYNKQFKIFEPLEFKYNVCEALLLWEQTVPNPVYLFQGIVLRRGAKGTGMKSVELALSMCDIVDIYGFTVDPGSWILESKIV